MPPRPLPIACAALGLIALTACRAVPRGEPPTLLEPVGTASGVPAGDPVDAALVRGLAEADFVARARSAEALVARGEAALPALGAAGDLPVDAHGRIPVSATRPVVESILARAPLDRVVGAHLQSPYPAIRREAAAEAGRRGDLVAVPALVDRLEDPDLAVRAAAVGALRRLTYRFEDVNPAAPPAARAADAARAREWWSSAARRGAASATGR